LIDIPTALSAPSSTSQSSRARRAAASQLAGTGAVQALAVGIEHVDLGDEPIGGLLTFHKAGQRPEVVERDAEGERSLNAVLDLFTENDQPAADNTVGRAPVLEIVQKRGHADGKQACQHGYGDHSMSKQIQNSPDGRRD
jgi:hypothetical protein